MSTKAYSDFYDSNSAKRFKSDATSSHLNNTSDSSLDDLNRSITSESESTSNQVPQMPLNSITNKVKPQLDFATAYNGLSSNYYSPHNYSSYSTNFQNPYTNQYTMPQYSTNQYPIYPNYNYQNRVLTSNRSSLGNSSSADSSALSLNLNSPTQVNDENVSPVQLNQVTNRQNPYNNLGMKETPSVPARSKVSNILNESSSSSSFNTENEDTLSTKKRRPVPVEHKDGSYWEKRRKNNESAKRSRDLRRCKEEHISIRVIYLEQENLQLKTENALMRSELEKLRAMLYATTN